METLQQNYQNLTSTLQSKCLLFCYENKLKTGSAIDSKIKREGKRIKNEKEKLKKAKKLLKILYGYVALSEKPINNYYPYDEFTVCEDLTEIIGDEEVLKYLDTQAKKPGTNFRWYFLYQRYKDYCEEYLEMGNRVNDINDANDSDFVLPDTDTDTDMI